MKPDRKSYTNRFLPRQPPYTNWIQPPLPCCPTTLPILVTIEDQGSGRQGPSPLIPPEEPVND